MGGGTRLQTRDNTLHSNGLYAGSGPLEWAADGRSMRFICSKAYTEFRPVFCGKQRILPPKPATNSAAKSAKREGAAKSAEDLSLFILLKTQ